MIRNALALLLVLTFLGSCKKDPAGPPSISYESPEKNQVFDFGEDIIIRGVARDEEQLKSFELRLLDEQGATARVIDRAAPSAKEYQFSHRLDFDNHSLVEGRYTLSAHLVGSSEEATYTRKIQLGDQDPYAGTAIVTLNSVFQQSKHTTYVNHLSTTGDMVKQWSFEGEYLGSATLNEFLFVSVFDNPYIRVKKIDLKNKRIEEIWQGGSLGGIRSHASGKQKIYIAFKQQTILGFDQTGQVFTVNMNKTPLLLTENSEKLFVYSRTKFGIQPEMQVYHAGTAGKLTGFIGQSTLVHGICSFENEAHKAYYIFNENNKATIVRVNDVLNSTSILPFKFSQPILELEEEAAVINNRALFATPAGGILGFSSSEVISEVFPPGAFSDVKAIRYDGNQYLGIVDGSSLKVYEGNGLTKVFTLEIGGQNSDAQIVTIP
ncbi:hypothetical protein KFE98_02280 [bacterium SCSIO 12741]|nr:hypothetical protein KFE98_02280 [bacterium SCSIO 12741]